MLIKIKVRTWESYQREQRSSKVIGSIKPARSEKNSKLAELVRLGAEEKGINEEKIKALINEALSYKF